MTMAAKRFLTASWRHLAMLNYEVDPEVLSPHLPSGTELDFWNNRTYVSLVGFEFQEARFWNRAVPFHRRFAEVNLRFYVRRQTPSGWRCGVSFIRELVARRAVSWVARKFYGENYLTVPLRSRFDPPNGNPQASHAQHFAWRYAGRDHSLEMSVLGTGAEAAPGTLEEFLVENYWGFSTGCGRGTIEYRVDHPRWKLWPVRQAAFRGEAELLFGKPLATVLAAPPTCAFYADGSQVVVYRGNAID